MSAGIGYPDLGAVLYPMGVPDGLGDELPGLYSTLLSTVEWFEVEDEVTPTGACVLDQPRHVLLFYRDNDTVEILNKEFAIAPRDAERACLAVFRALPRARRIHLEVTFPPGELRLPKRVLYGTDHMVVDLPDTVEAYTASLGKKTRQHLRRSQRRLQQDYGGLVVETIFPVADADDLVSQFVSWKNLRFSAMGQPSVWQTHPEGAGYVVELVRRRGQARVTSIEGTMAAIHFLFPVGTSMYVLQSGFDPEYLPYSLGMLGTYDVACEAITGGFQRLSLLWGPTEHKLHLGARPKRATRLSVFPSQTARIHSLDEAREVAVRDLRRTGQRYYWRARHKAGRALRVMRPGGRDDGERRGADA